MYKYIIEDIAQIELEYAIGWYEGKGENLGALFFHNYKETLALICKNPFLFQKTFQDVREAIIKKFPYSIIYLVNEHEKSLNVISIFNQLREPYLKFQSYNY